MIWNQCELRKPVHLTFCPELAQNVSGLTNCTLNNLRLFSMPNADTGMCLGFWMVEICIA